jgi:hypothetical protein
MGRDDRAGTRPRDAGHVPFGVAAIHKGTCGIVSRAAVADTSVTA